MVSEDVEMAVKEVEIEFLRYIFDGFWNFPKRPDKKITDVKYVFYGPVLPALIATILVKIF